VKKIKVYLPLFVIVTIFGISYIAIIPKAYSVDYYEQVSTLYHKMWYLGEKLSIGDSYTYKICDPQSIKNYNAESYHSFTQNKEHDSSLCYIIKLDFVNHLSSDENNNIDNDDIWIVQATMRNNMDDDTIRHAVFHINPYSFEVKSADTIHPDMIRYADSLQNTIFSIFKYANEHKLLKTGTKWGQVTEYLSFGSNPYMTVLDDNMKYSATQNTIIYDSNTTSSIDKVFSNVSKVGYDVDIVNNNKDVTTYYLISPNASFPLSGVKYSPVHIVRPFKIFEFELLAYTSKNNYNGTVENNTASMQDTVVPSIDEININNDTNSLNNDQIFDNTNDLVSDSNQDTIADDTNNQDSITTTNIVNDNNVIKNTRTTNNDILKDTIISNNVIENNIQNNINESLSTTDSTIHPTSIIADTNIDLKFLLAAIMSISVITVGVFVYLKIKKTRLKHVLKNYLMQNQRKKSFNKIIYFKDTVTIKINKTNDTASYSLEAKS
jgi:hypothetical protein